jgi:hypothetical protein
MTRSSCRRGSRSGRIALGSLLAGLGLGCSSDRLTGPERPAEVEGLVVSAVYSVTDAARQVQGAALLLPTTQVYVSLVPGTVPEGTRADITNLTESISTAVSMLEGGFDPISLPAKDGDAIEVVTRTESGQTRRFASTAMLKKPPVVVRSGPTRGATDVSLNALIVIVFSEPMDGTTLGVGVTLAGPGGRVPVVLDLSGDDVTVAVTPAEPLQPGTDYELTVDERARSGRGVPLENPYRLQFTTVVDLPVGFVLGFGPTDTTFEAGSRVKAWVGIWDSNTGEELKAPVTWISSDPSVARVAPDGWVQGVGVGTVRILPTIAGISPELRLTFTPLRFTAVSAGGKHTCALSATGAAWCWGSNSSGQLGTGDGRDRLLPAPVAGDLRFTALQAGEEHTCAVTADGSPYCWGSDRHWQLGRLDRQAAGEPRVRLQPTALPGGPGFSRLSAGGAHGCGSAIGGAVWCWGALRSDAEALYLDRPRPLDSPGLELIASGQDHACGVASTGEAYCWGRNDRGQLGDGTRSAFPAPVGAMDTVTSLAAQTVAGGLTFSTLSAGALHTCGLAGGNAYCWGDATAGQLGGGWAAGSSLVSTPVAVVGDMTFGSVTAGGRHTCALDVGARAWCWGANGAGQLGDGGRENQGTPAAVSESFTFAAIDAGAAHTCGIRQDGLLYCWGDGSAGQLGSGFAGTVERPVPVGLQH